MSKTPSDERRERAALVTVTPETPISEALQTMDRAGLGMLLLAGADGRLQGVVTDGDIRRALLRHQPLSDPCLSIATTHPVTAALDVTEAEALVLMKSGRGVAHLPLVDDEGKVAGLLLQRDLISDQSLDVSAVVMAGGYGKRLQPLTLETPKSLLPIGGRPIVERMMEELRASGIHHVRVSTHHQADKIREYFGDGSSLGIDLAYVSEDEPLGTAGALSLVDAPHDTLLVVNGDILTNLNFRAMLQFHREHGADLTVAVRPYEQAVPYGVIECEGANVVRLREKPVFHHLVSAGIYLLETSVQRLVPPSTRFDMTDVIDLLLKQGRPVVSFPIHEYWLDIGRHEDYEQAQRDVADGRLRRE